MRCSAHNLLPFPSVTDRIDRALSCSSGPEIVAFLELTDVVAIFVTMPLFVDFPKGTGRSLQNRMLNQIYYDLLFNKQFK